VQGKPREREEIKKVTATRKAALEAAVDLANQGIVLVGIIRVADGRVYTAEELATAVINREE
jgi:formate dehydrogenase assembly factor FdhD